MLGTTAVVLNKNWLPLQSQQVSGSLLKQQKTMSIEIYKPANPLSRSEANELGYRTAGRASMGWASATVLDWTAQNGSMKWEANHLVPLVPITAQPRERFDQCDLLRVGNRPANWLSVQSVGAGAAAQRTDMR